MQQPEECWQCWGGCSSQRTADMTTGASLLDVAARHALDMLVWLLYYSVEEPTGLVSCFRHQMNK
jgi:hypothetical protein